jgi:hypothetical protein
MQRTLVLCLVFVGLLALPNYLSSQQSQGIPSLQQGRFQLVGFTSETYTGDQGVFGFTLACQAEFPDSRFCTVEDVVETTVIPENLPTDLAWINPDLVGGGVVGRATAHDCGSWSLVTSAHGFTMDASGKFQSQSCWKLKSVACCALVP